MYHIIYKTTNLLSRHFYYGVHSTENLNDDYLGSGKRLLNAINKYGKQNFMREIVSFHDTREEALYFEKKLVTPELLKEHKCYNIVEGGGAPPKHLVVGKDSSLLLRGDDRTPKQKLASKLHSERMLDRPAPNKQITTLWDKTFPSRKEAKDYFGITEAQYQYMINCDKNFNDAQELKAYIWAERNRKIGESRLCQT